MRRFSTFSGFVALLVIPVLGQTPPVRSIQTRPAETGAVPVERKLRYLVDQLGLDEQQKQHAEGLFAVLQVESKLAGEAAKELLDEIRGVALERAAAKEAGDTARAEELNQRLKSLTPGIAAERRFIEGLKPALNEAQRAKLETLLKRLEGAELSLKPIHVVRAARELQLSPEQQRALDQVVEDFRKKVAEGGELDVLRRAEFVDTFIGQVGAVLRPDQRAKFEQKIAELQLMPQPRAVPTTRRATTQPAPGK